MSEARVLLVALGLAACDASPEPPRSAFMRGSN